MTADTVGGQRRLPSLLELAVARVTEDLSVLRQYPCLPEDVCYMVLGLLRRRQALDDGALHHFSRLARLRRFSLSGSQVTATGLGSIVSQPVEWLDVSNCTGLRHNAVQVIIQFSFTLRHLDISQSEIPGGAFLMLGRLERLLSLNLADTLIIPMAVEQLSPSLTSLNLARTGVTSSDVSNLKSLPNLRELVLTGTSISPSCLPSLCVPRHLEILDVSDCEFLQQSEEQSAVVLGQFFDGLAHLAPTLECLNLSCTAADSQSIETVVAALPNLRFLGAVSVSLPDAPLRPDLVVAALNDHQQAITALNTADVGSFSITLEVLRAVFRFLSPSENSPRMITSDRPCITGKTLDALSRHWDNLDMQVVTSAVLFYTTLDGFRDQQPETRARALASIVNAMRDNFSHLQLVKNCCLTLRNFQRDDELIPCATDLAQLLLQAVLEYDDRTVQLTAIFVCCHSLAALHPDHKQAIGQAGCLELTMRIIERCKGELEGDSSLLESCWTFLWNVTDETPANSHRFLEHGGLDLCVEVLALFSTNVAVRRNIMGLVANLAEVQEIRSMLMSSSILPALRACLREDVDLEVAYNVTGTLAHLIAEGPELWMAANRQDEVPDICSELATAVSKWHIGGERWINYRSLGPVVMLLRPELPWEVHYWACWALASLCTSNASKYCPMSFSDGAVDALQRVTIDYQASMAPAVRLHSNGMATGDVFGPAAVLEHSTMALRACEAWQAAHGSGGQHRFL